MDEGDEEEEQQQKEIYRSSSNSKINRLLSKSQKSNNSPIASPASGISTRKRRSIDYSQQSSLEYTPGGGDSSEMTTPSMNIHQQEAPFIFESLANIKDESSEHSMDLPMTTTIHLPIKQEGDEQPMKSLRTQTSQKSGKGKPVFENRTYGGEISKKRARRVRIEKIFSMNMNDGLDIKQWSSSCIFSSIINRSNSNNHNKSTTYWGNCWYWMSWSSTENSKRNSHSINSNRIV
jgi:hypothetical protein